MDGYCIIVGPLEWLIARAYRSPHLSLLFALLSRRRGQGSALKEIAASADISLETTRRGEAGERANIAGYSRDH